MKSSSVAKLHWDDAPVFLAIARQGTLSAAARELDLGVATVSRRIERLESGLGVALFLRHQSGYTLTDEGAELLSRAETLESAMAGFRPDTSPTGPVRGHVRLATAENLANGVIIPALAPLLVEHPQLTIDIVTDVASINLHRQDADLAVRMTRPSRGNLKVRRVGTLGLGLYGSSEYLASRQPLTDTLDFEHHRFIGWSDVQTDLPAAQWLERALRGGVPVLTTTTLSAQVQAASAGIGLAVLPHFLARDAGLQALPIVLGIDHPIWLVVHSDLSASRRVRVVADRIAQTLANASSRLEG
ncbi:LysR family transcriptional regulator [Granulosicoccus antarcticus]|uniref:HTH-type transcriptional regulator PgrR n=1 Tax=Granulosicoccus antarcticus IMCC3135 TaxID=1192854 RepID=A0A2Z2NTL0_9GAMM|nr:LysR family transcriptional regulator [Granulosicoccus antarcticus]ASJ70957.1 HTH-type transcriptional regulator PgrR [Granulosicoccus antarcticus IMCC3135]